MYLDPIDETNPVSILHMTRGKLRDAIEALPDDLALMTERELRSNLKPTNVDYCLRVAFWREYELAVREKREHVAARTILTGICSDAYFYQKFLKDIYKVAWLVRPVQAYMKEIEAVLMRGTERLWELMELDIMVPNKNGEYSACPRLAAVLLETIKMVEARSKGHAMLRTEMRSVSVNLNQNPVGVPIATDHRSLQARMKSLSERMHGIAAMPGSDVEEIETELIGESVEGTDAN